MEQEFEKMKEKYPDKFRLDFAVSREQANAKGEKMYIQTRMAEYAEELWDLLKKDNTYVYMCGLKGMEKGIDDIMVSLAAKDGKNINLCTNHFALQCYRILFCSHECPAPLNLIISWFSGIDWIEYKKQLKKAEQWNVEVY